MPSKKGKAKLEKTNKFQHVCLQPCGGIARRCAEALNFVYCPYCGEVLEGAEF